MSSVKEWLASLGLSEYADRFAEHRIDFSILRDITDRDLKEELGVVSLGDRRRLLRAIAHLAEATSAAPQLAPGFEASRGNEAERRQVTVMFSDLVGSTALSACMDPEDLREIISAYQQCAVEAVRRFDGFVARYMGDGVLVYFGYPQAHEDDAERAIRAGLELITAVTALKTRAFLQTRVGMATGLVVVGDLIGSGESQERGIVGETPNLAARLQGIAEPNTVVIAKHAQTSRQSLRTGGSRAQGDQGHRPADAGVGGAAGEFRGKSLRGAAPDGLDRLGRAQRGTRIAAAVLVQGNGQRRPGSAALRRSRYREITAHDCVLGISC